MIFTIEQEIWYCPVLDWPSEKMTRGICLCLYVSLAVQGDNMWFWRHWSTSAGAVQDTVGAVKYKVQQ